MSTDEVRPTESPQPEPLRNDGDNLIHIDIDALDDVETIQKIHEVQEQDDSRAEKIRQARPEPSIERPAADNAIIEQVIVENFMNHARLKITLGPFINFIVGRNGSGKSAVLAAISLCLGGKSKERASSIRGYIKQGEESGMVSVKLKNQGSSAYQPEQYGDSIIVERHISKSSGSSYKIKNAMGKIVTTRASDLADIMDSFAMQIDNPITILSQDAAKSFLVTSTPFEKYQFFLKGTQLEQLAKDYRLLEDTLDALEAQKTKSEASLRAAESRKTAAKKRLDASASQEVLREQIEKVRKQTAWRLVTDEEESRDRLVQELTLAESMVQQQQATLADVETRYSELQVQLEKACEHANEAEAAVGPIKADLDTKKSEIDSLAADMQSALEDERNMQGEIQSKRNEISQNQNKKDEALKRQSAADDGSLARIHDEISEAKSRLEEATQRLDVHTARFPVVEREQKEAQHQLDDSKSKLDASRADMQRAQQMLDEHTNKQSNWMGGYRRELSSVLRAIEAERRFKTAPIGPMGRHIQLLKPEWSSVLESSFGMLLNAFVVSDKNDQSLLHQIFKKARYHAPIYINNGERINVDQEPDPQQLTWLRALKITNEKVRNVCIIVQSIDQIALIPSRAVASDFVNSHPRNVKACLAMHETKKGSGHRLIASATGGRAMNNIQAYPGHPRMQSDAGTQLTIYRDNLEHTKHEYQVMQRKVKELEAVLRQRRDVLVSFNKETRNLRVAKEKAADDIEILKEQLEDATPQAAGELAVFDRQISLAQTALSVAEDSLRASRQERTNSHQAQTALKTAWEEIKQRLKKYERQAARAKSTRDEIEKARQTMLYEKSQAVAAVQNAVAEQGRAERDVKSQEARIAEAEELATDAAGPRVQVDLNDTSKQLESRYLRLQRELQTNIASTGATHQELCQLAAEATADRNEIARNVNVIKKQADALKHSMADRLARWQKFRRYISSRARIMFTYLLQQRRFRGHLKIDPHKKQLDISVEPDATKEGETGRQSKTLSGGEKSFSTICLLLALWDAMGSPLRCLDEYDVFMDNKIRSESTKMMIQAARQSVSRQFILITPHGVSDGHTEKDINVFRMPDPERGQQTLPFSVS
ncbi:P-loop containing nucleoside triphosphate hydrolase protein [Pseudovirgaria hyperparasitica]|uniref:P-loop containing nucleoside triphosphate hydrolase protein n=1 Tax=Pseudovirgaria hyperparasitica TaxID=470096 RepID=A0A6A6WD40_9PEZI|nr:P-loop containing nucleoside triphosphate hydrolase protein [Pseudovirgaria hyperparasitica]KAF2760752.1 P-loop containing nucleoside triphosphate hydrolase protein [Pseudovirgaria hyperparasitica]